MSHLDLDASRAGASRRMSKPCAGHAVDSKAGAECTTASIESFLRTATPLGEVLLVAQGACLTGAYFPDQKHFPARSGDWREDPGDCTLQQAARELEEYFQGRRHRFDIALAPEGTAFRRRVWNALQSLRFGETCSYGELATRAGARGAARAVGAAVGRNPLSIFIPCHRAIGGDGTLHGYAGGLERKRALLALEGRHFPG